MVNWKNVWYEYVRGNVVSEYGAKLIQRFLLNTMASYGKAVDDGQSEANASEEESDMRLLKMPSIKFPELIQTGTAASIINEKLIISAKANAKLASER